MNQSSEQGPTEGWSGGSPPSQELRAQDLASAGQLASPAPNGSSRQDGGPDRAAAGASAGGGVPERLVPVALSALLEGIGQAYNRQPAKAAAMVVAGLGLSTASGLNTWLARRLLGGKQVTIGPERINPWLLAAWAATYGYALWDAWAGASARSATKGSVGAASGDPASALPNGG